jgi:hypothetical protein
MARNALANNRNPPTRPRDLLSYRYYTVVLECSLISIYIGMLVLQWSSSWREWVAIKIGLNGLDPDLDRNKHRINLE